MGNQKKQLFLGTTLSVRLLLLVGIYGMVWHIDVSGETGKSKSRDESGSGTSDRSKSDAGSGDAAKKVTTQSGSSTQSKPASTQSKSTSTQSKSKSTGAKTVGAKSSSSGKKGGAKSSSMSTTKEGEMGILPVRRGQRKERETAAEKKIEEMTVVEYGEFLDEKLQGVTTKEGSFTDRSAELNSLVEETKPQVSDPDYLDKKDRWERFEKGLRDVLNVS